MNVDNAKRIVGLVRQQASIRTMKAKGVLSEIEADLLVANLQDEIAKIRSQTELSLGGTGASSAPVKAAK